MHTCQEGSVAKSWEISHGEGNFDPCGKKGENDEKKGKFGFATFFPQNDSKTKNLPRMYVFGQVNIAQHQPQPPCAHFCLLGWYNGHRLLETKAPITRIVCCMFWFWCL